MKDAAFLVLAKRRPGLDRCLAYLRAVARDVEVVLGNRGDAWPDRCARWDGEFVVSYMSPWIVPGALLRRARVAAINFHPGPPEYPGTGCANFAIYHGEAVYGVTAHHMEPTVDMGPIIAVQRFRCRPDETVSSLTQESYRCLADLFETVIGAWAATGVLPVSPERWGRRPYTRRELEELCRVTPDMAPEEVTRRIRATTFPGQPGAYVKIAGYRFDYRADVAADSSVPAGEAR